MDNLKAKDLEKLYKLHDRSLSSRNMQFVLVQLSSDSVKVRKVSWSLVEDHLPSMPMRTLVDAIKRERSSRVLIEVLRIIITEPKEVAEELFNGFDAHHGGITLRYYESLAKISIGDSLSIAEGLSLFRQLIRPSIDDIMFGAFALSHFIKNGGERRTTKEFADLLSGSRVLKIAPSSSKWVRFSKGFCQTELSQILEGSASPAV